MRLKHLLLIGAVVTGCGAPVVMKPASITDKFACTATKIQPCATMRTGTEIACSTDVYGNNTAGQPFRPTAICVGATESGDPSGSATLPCDLFDYSTAHDTGYVCVMACDAANGCVAGAAVPLPQ